jgi:hypothetical protein
VEQALTWAAWLFVGGKLAGLAYLVLLVLVILAVGLGTYAKESIAARRARRTHTRG